MKLTKRSVVLLALMMLFIILFSVLTGIAGLTVDNLLPEDDDHSFVGSFMAIWGRMTVHQILSGLMLGISILALFGVYLGGRSNHRRFNDRTLDSMHLFGVSFRDGSTWSRLCFPVPHHLPWRCEQALE